MECCVYIIIDGNSFSSSDHFKIGNTSYPLKRIKQLQTGNPKKLYFYEIYVFPNKKVAEYFESYLHSYFTGDDDNSHGEWFLGGLESLNTLKMATNSDHFTGLLEIQNQDYQEYICSEKFNDWVVYNAKK